MAATEPEPSRFFLDNAARLHAAAAEGPVVDLASGRGRHARLAGDWGLRTIALDRNPDFLRQLTAAARRRRLPLEAIRADLETEHEIPLMPNSCGAILVFRFLYRPLASAIESRLRPGGLLLYETFTEQQLELDWGPRRRAFTLALGELPGLFPNLLVEAYEEGIVAGARPEACARLVARKPR